MEAGFLGAAAAPEPQERPDRMEQKRARPVLNAPPAIRGRRDFPGVDSGKNLGAAAAARHSESSGPGHGATMRARTQPARLALPLHLSRTPFPTSTHPRSSLSCEQTARVYDSAFMAQRWHVGYSGALRSMRACAGRHAEVKRRLCPYACHMFGATFVARGEHDERGWAM